MCSLRPPLRALLLAVSAAAIGASPLRAQVNARPLSTAPTIPAGEADALARLQQLIGSAPVEPRHLRSTTTGLDRALGDAGGFALFLPEVELLSNSAHPWSWNDGPLRAGKGLNLIATFGIGFKGGGVTLLAMPQRVYEENASIPVFPYPDFVTPPRKEWANPFHGPPESIDLPLRYGPQARTAWAGQYRASFDLTHHFRVGAGNENRWWGPGVRNALLLSSTGPGFTHAFLETQRPLVTRFGEFEITWLAGRLDESEFFDTLRTNDTRGLSAAAVNWRPPAARSALVPEIGIARAVMTVDPPSPNTMFNFLLDVGRPYADSSDVGKERDQLLALWARWARPESGFEAWVEWARYEQAINLRDLLVNPGHSQGYTLGFSWARPLRGGTLLLQSEFSYAEPSPSIRVRPAIESYTSASVPQGWTHQGQMLGPAMGPAGSTQWGQLDWRGSRWRLGTELGRLRRDNGVVFREQRDVARREDVSLWLTLRLGRRIGPWNALLEFTDAARLNYLYQAFDLPPEEGGWTGVDLQNRTVRFVLSPVPQARGRQ